MWAGVSSKQCLSVTHNALQAQSSTPLVSITTNLSPCANITFNNITPLPRWECWSHHNTADYLQRLLGSQSWNKRTQIRFFFQCFSAFNCDNWENKVGSIVLCCCIELVSAFTGCVRADGKFNFLFTEVWQQNKMDCGQEGDGVEEGSWCFLNALWSAAVVHQGQKLGFDESRNKTVIVGAQMKAAHRVKLQLHIKALDVSSPHLETRFSWKFMIRVLFHFIFFRIFCPV